MDERFGVLPEESEDSPERLDTLYKECTALVDDFVGAIGLMLGNQPSDHEQAMIRSNLTQQIEGYFHNNIQGFPALTPPQQIGCFKFLANELRAFLELPCTPEGFMQGQILIDRYLHDDRRKADSRRTKPLAEEALAAGQREIMSRIKLSEYETITTDTSEALQQLVPLIYDPMLLATAEDPDHLNILELGIGEGRIAIPLALLGHRVSGIDISPQALQGLEERLNAVLVVIQNGTADALTAPIIDAFSKLGIDYQAKVAENSAALKSQITVSEGDFFQPETYDNIPDNSLDVCTIMWHTFGFAGKRETENILLSTIYRKLRPGGLLLIEMPDPNFGPYARAINEFDRQEEEKLQADPSYMRYPRGTIIDAPSSDISSPTTSQAQSVAIRYFPNFPELAVTLIEADFIQSDIRPYFVRQKSDSGQEILMIKEGLFVVQKPYTQDQVANLDHQKMIEYQIAQPQKVDIRKRPGWYRCPELRKPLPDQPPLPNQD